MCEAKWGFRGSGLQHRLGVSLVLSSCEGVIIGRAAPRHVHGMGCARQAARATHAMDAVHEMLVVRRCFMVSALCWDTLHA